MLHQVRFWSASPTGKRGWVRILPLMSRMRLTRPHDPPLSVRLLRGEQVRHMLEHGSWVTMGKHAWTAGGILLQDSSARVRDVPALAGYSGLRTLDLTNTRVAGVPALAGCSSLHTLNLSSTEMTDVLALAGCSSLRTLEPHSTGVAVVPALAGCSSLH